MGQFITADSAQRTPFHGRSAAATVADVTRPPLTTVTQYDHVAAAAYLMKHTGTTALIVTDAQTGQPAGIITEADIAHAIAAGKDVNDVRVHAVMTRSAQPPARLPALSYRADLRDGLGGHGDDAVASTDADGGSWPVHERAAPGLAAGGGDRDSGGTGGSRPPARKCGDHSQDQGHDGDPDSGPQPPGGLPGGRQSADAISGVTDGVSNPADSEDRQGSSRKRGHSQSRRQPLDCRGGRAAGSAQDAANADEAQDGHLDGVPAAGGCRKLC
jgi:CBS domain protein